SPSSTGCSRTARRCPWPPSCRASGSWALSREPCRSCWRGKPRGAGKLDRAGAVRASARRHDRAAAFAEADAGKALAAAARAHDQGVPVLEETAALAGGELDRAATAGGDFEQAAELAVAGTRDRAGAEDVSRSQVAAVATVMGDELRNAPVEIAGIAGG